MAQGLSFHAAAAGFVDHTQTTVFSGGASGAPQTLWENTAKRDEIQAVLDTGNVELFGMSYEPAYPTTEGYENWIDYALAQNPDTRFFIGLPWADFQESYDAATYSNAWLGAHDGPWHDFIDDLKALYPGVVIYCIPYGRSAGELRNLYAAGNLPDVVTLVSSTQDSIFNDTKGHADDDLSDLRTQHERPGDRLEHQLRGGELSQARRRLDGQQQAPLLELGFEVGDQIAGARVADAEPQHPRNVGAPRLEAERCAGGTPSQGRVALRSSSLASRARVGRPTRTPD